MEADVRDFIPMSPPRMYNRDSGELELCQQKPSPRLPKKIVEEPQPIDNKESESPPAVSTDSESEDEAMVEVMETINLAADLKEFDSSVNKKKKKKKANKTKKDSVGSPEEQVLIVDERERQIRNNLFTACKLGNVEGLRKIIEEICIQEADENLGSNLNTVCDSTDTPESNSCQGTSSHSSGLYANEDVTDVRNMSIKGESRIKSQGHPLVNLEKNGISVLESSGDKSNNTPTMISRLLNVPMLENSNTFLHLVSSEGHCDMVSVLMENGADPSIKNEGGKLPYNLGNADIRNVFRRFMAQFPDKYDYAKAQIPSPLTAEMEEEKRQKLAKKRAEKKKASNERNKAKKAVEKQIQKEEEEKSRFLSLSDREKRALAAEKRLLQQHNEQGFLPPVCSRCWQCGSDISGKIPFEYSNYKFCTTQCLRDHRGKVKS